MYVCVCVCICICMCTLKKNKKTSNLFLKDTFPEAP